MQSSTSSLVADRAPRACTSCQYRKKKCDKSIPRCTHCQRRNRTCDYSDFIARKWTVSCSDSPVVSPRSQTVLRLVQDKDRHFQTSSYASRPVEESGFPAVFFLDTRLFLRAQLEIPRPELPIPRHVHDLIGNAASIKDTAVQFFKTTHSWLPILSKRRFYDCLLNPLLQPRPDIALLLLSIRLITIPPLSDVPTSKTPVYLAAKQFYSDVVAVGTCSVQVLQAGILISLYELGHALYPSAYLSIASCARYGVAFGINGKDPSQAKFSLNGNWNEAEERKRSWWAVLILDRFVNLGNPTRVLATEEPQAGEILPIDDDAWDDNTMAKDQFTLSSPSSLSMGRFARFSQAIYHLGQVFQHASDHTSGDGCRKERVQQLRRTIYALMRVSEIEGQVRNMGLCTQMAVCYSALLILTGPDSLNAGDVSNRSKDGDCATDKESASQEAANVARTFLMRPAVPVEEISVSPFMLHFFYQASAIYLESNQEAVTGASSEALVVLKKILNVLNARWKAAGAYLKILEAREVMNFS